MAKDVMSEYAEGEPNFKKDKSDERKRLEEEREFLREQSKLRGIKKESFDLKHHKLKTMQKTGERASSRVLSFAGDIAKEGIRATRSRKTRRGKGGVRVRQSMAYPGVFHPVSTDISLAKAIAMNNWSGANTGIMERDFFGTESGQRELLGDRNKDVNIGSNIHQQFFGEKKNMDLIGSTTGHVDLLGSDKKSKKIQYI